MKYEIVFGLLAALCVLGAHSEETTPEAPAAAEEGKDKICEPGTLSEVNCNTCICNKAGTELACTKKICVDTKESEVKPENLPVAEGDSEAKAQNFPDFSKISESITSHLGKRRRRRSDEEDACKPGESFKKECNDCVCPDSGKKSEAVACTLIAC